MNEHLFGIEKYNLNIEGIGGTLKQYPEDFIVTEIDDQGNLVTEKKRLNDSGIYLHLVVSKRNTSHERLLYLLRDYFKVAEEQITYGGIKDKRAVTHQEIAIFQPKRNFNELEPEPWEGILMRNIGWTNRGLKKGHIWGNHFEIIIRDGRTVSEPEHVASKLETEGVYNYYGHQRFGGSRPVTADFGIALMKKDYQKAVDIFLGIPSDDREQDFRKQWRESRDGKYVLENSIEIPKLERRMLESLTKYPGEYKRALEKLPRFLHNIASSAVISLLFNKYISRRGENLLQGEREVILEKRRNIEIALPSNRWPKPLNPIWNELFEEHELEIKHFKNTRHSSRMLFVYPQDVLIENGDEGVELQFKLHTGSYATIICREIMG